ncbi:MAG: hypothetical protein QOD99_2028, partial [Chthoniobacter sp.]|nr:hypothetical protein [Chthoniobacter sp.]
EQGLSAIDPDFFLTLNKATVTALNFFHC